MKIYSDKLTDADIVSMGRPFGVWVHSVSMERARVRSRGWTVSTEGNSRRWKNTGKFGASSSTAASWDAHGYYFAALFEADPRAVVVACGRYDGARDFDRQTDGRYTVPADFPVRPLRKRENPPGRTECGACGRAWDDEIITSWTPAPSARCPFEHFHASEA